MPLCRCRIRSCHRVMCPGYAGENIFSRSCWFILSCGDNLQDLIEAINHVRFERFDRVLHQVGSTCSVCVVVRASQLAALATKQVTSLQQLLAEFA